ncbi:MAG: MBL fold metallo-hydrolase [Chloroflexi bacterium]|nr:MBL fold metallo-hydrolase [Chloroflexota bacterium]
MRVRFLGTSTSYGVPVIGCRCATCTSPDPRNKRTRASVYVETDEGVRLLIDSGPEIRLQALREGITHIDAVLYTHFHADHTAGIDDLKAFNASLGGLLPCFGDPPTGASACVYSWAKVAFSSGPNWPLSATRYMILSSGL